MEDDKNPSQRKTPPKTPDDHEFIWVNAERARRTWPIAVLFVVVLENWKAAATVVALVVWFARPEIIGALSTLLGMGP
jgi:hypothetical protein